jgi:hypothetical protein
MLTMRDFFGFRTNHAQSSSFCGTLAENMNGDSTVELHDRRLDGLFTTNRRRVA